MLQNSAAL